MNYRHAPDSESTLCPRNPPTLDLLIFQRGETLHVINKTIKDPHVKDGTGEPDFPERNQGARGLTESHPLRK